MDDLSMDDLWMDDLSMDDLWMDDLVKVESTGGLPMGGLSRDESMGGLSMGDSATGEKKDDSATDEKKGDSLMASVRSMVDLATAGSSPRGFPHGLLPHGLLPRGFHHVRAGQTLHYTSRDMSKSGTACKN